MLKTQAYINGKWTNAESGKQFSVLNPATKKEIAQVSDCDEKEIQQAIESAHNAFKTWKNTSAGERANLLRKWFDLMIQHKDELGNILALEAGKPLQEAIGEVVYGASFIEWFAEEARRAYGDIIPGHQANKRIQVIRQPIGVTVAITPWNFPNAMITRKVGAALAAGCTMIVKPSEETPLSALAMAELAEKAGFPSGVLQFVTTSNAKLFGEIVTASSIVKKISFTGSTQVGKWLMEKSAGTLKKLSLELGGNAPFIVFDDADLEAATDGALASKFRNNGQTCVCANRIFVQEGIYDAFVKRFTEKVKAQKVGNPFDQGVSIGPLINYKAVQKVSRLITDATDKGASVICGGTLIQGEGHFFEPTVITKVNATMEIAHEEIFGPIAPIFSFKTAEEVIEKANDTSAGLAAYIYASNYKTIYQVSEALEYGMVGVNTGMISTTVAPFGGVKESGFGREGSKYGMDEYQVMKYICLEV
ncbi:NAD-dependent succinate-semialdehyde dehydrogenase [bacterium]|nr:MAG: NAD-dependent succinate-semialdehyde dehydrogenase [bacterium]